MPKQKTHRGAAKRFRVTGSGKIKRSHARVRHLFAHKEVKVKRKLDLTAYVHESDAKNIRQLIPYKF